MFGWGRKKQEAAPEPRVLGLDEVGPALEQVLEDEARLLVDRTGSLRDAIDAHMSEMVRIAGQMDSDEPGDDVDARVAAVARRGKKQVVEAIRKHAGPGAGPAGSVEEVRAFNKDTAYVLSHVGDVLGKQTRVIHMFSKKHAGRLKEILAAYSDDSKGAADLLRRYDSAEAERARAAELVDQIRGCESGAKEARARAESLSADAERLDAEAAARAESAGRFRESDAYKEYSRIVAEIGALEKKRRDVELRIGGITAPVSKAVSKYRYGSSLDKAPLAVAAAMLDSPLDAFVPANRADIEQILANTRKAVELGHMSVKDPAKTAASLGEAAARIDEMIGAVSDHAGERGRLEAELARADVGPMKADERAAARAREDAGLARSRGSEALAEADALEAKRPGLVEELSSAASRACGSPCRIRA